MLFSSDLLRRVIVEQMANIMVLPNKLPITLSDAVPAQSLKFPEPEVRTDKSIIF